MAAVPPPDDAQRRAARFAGLAYLLALGPAIFAEFVARGRLVSDDAARTALAIAAHERLFRLGIAANLAVFALDVALIAALYVALAPVGRRLALTALGWGLVETSILAVATLSDLDVLRVLGGAPYLEVFEPNRLHALARLAVSAHGSAYVVALVFAGLRSTAFCVLWLHSRWVPRGLAGFGVVASVLMGASSFLFIPWPELARAIPIAVYGGPIFLFELTMGAWLLVRGIASPRAA